MPGPDEDRLPPIPKPDLDLEEFRRFLYGEQEIIVLEEERSELDFESLLLASGMPPKRP